MNRSDKKRRRSCADEKVCSRSGVYQAVEGRVYLVLPTGLHCADAIFHLPALCRNTTVVASWEFSLPDLVVRMPVRIAVSPKRRTDTSLKVRSICESCFCCSPALGAVFVQMNPVG